MGEPQEGFIRGSLRLGAVEHQQPGAAPYTPWVLWSTNSLVPHLLLLLPPQMQYSIKVQMLEIYNESLRDLLVRDPRSGAKLDLLNTQPSGCNVKNAEQVDVSEPHAVLELMARGSRNRHVAGTSMNERSSRSHQVLTVIVDGVSRVTGATTHACLNLVDLAGSERVSKSKAAGKWGGQRPVQAAMGGWVVGLV